MLEYIFFVISIQSGFYLYLVLLLQFLRFIEVKCGDLSPMMITYERRHMQHSHPNELRLCQRRHVPCFILEPHKRAREKKNPNLSIVISNRHTQSKTDWSILLPEKFDDLLNTTLVKSMIPDILKDDAYLNNNDRGKLKLLVPDQSCGQSCAWPSSHHWLSLHCQISWSWQQTFW